jgi:arylsulfatase A-like enzyme
MPAPAPTTQRVILVVWDGMRPDYVTEELTPNLCALAGAGARYRRAVGIYPSVTRPTTSSVSTGSYPAAHGVLSNIFVGPPGDRALIDTGDRASLERLRAINNGRMLPMPTLAEAVAAAGKKIVVMGSGSNGQVVLLDPERVGTTIHVGFTLPESLMATLTERFGPVPAKAIPVNAANDWLNTVLLDYVLPELAPDVAIMWLCEPDASQHAVGLGAEQTLEAIRGNDARLGKLLAAVEASGVPTTIMVASDHGHSTVVGMVRTAETLREAGFADALDRGQILLGEQAIHVEDGPDAEDLRAAIGEWLAAQTWVGALFDWRNGTAPTGALTPGATWGDRERPALIHAPTFTYSHAWTEEPNVHGALGSSFAGFTASMADFERLQGPIVGLNRLTATHGTISPRDQRTVLVLSGAGIRPGTPDLPAGVIDLAPTILALLGLPSLPDADGRALVESLASHTDAPPTVTTEPIATAPGGPLRRHRVGTTAYLDTSGEE